MHKETECSHNPAGPPREIEVLISPPPRSRGNADSSGSARSSGEWLNPSPSQCTDLLPFSLNWAYFMFQGAQEPMAPWVGMKSPGLLFPAVDEIRPDKADPWFPSLPKASPAHPWTLPRSASSLSTTNSKRITRFEWKPRTTCLPHRLFTCLKGQLGYFSPPLSLPSSSPALT